MFLILAYMSRDCKIEHGTNKICKIHTAKSNTASLCNLFEAETQVQQATVAECAMLGYNIVQVAKSQ